ncbi:YccF domain-containing protein [Nakamurella sp.]|uniref:YccF domain-containing protein n=1 Tax=Nakamurella sp. TaxID=1869182 RepID=UPI003B3A8898
MRVILNIIWLVLCGFWMFLGYILAGIVACILIITIPFGIASFRIAGFALWPFGRTMVNRPDAGSPSFVGNVIWFIFAGLWLAIGHLVTGLALCLTIIGIPLAVANFKLIPISLAPLGKQVVRLDDPRALQTVS